MTPPRLPKLLLTFLLPERYRDQQIGDLDEGFRSRATPSGVARARAWYWRQVLKSVGPAISLRIRHARLPKPSESNAMDTLFQDLRFAVRAMIKRPSFAVVATATLALAIGVNTAIFSLVSVIVFADLPMQDKATVSVIRSTNPQQDIDRAGVSYADFLDIRDQVESLESVSALTGAQWVMSTDDGEPLRVTGNRITVNTLDTWRLSTVAGRGFLPGEDLLDAEPVAIMAHNVWVSRFGSDPGVVGSTFRLDGVEHTVVGIMTPKMEFADLGDAEFWVPTRLDRESEPRDQRVFYVSGRLRPGATHAQVQQQIAVVSSRLADEYPTSHGGWVLSAQPVQDSLVDDQADTILLLLSMTVAFVLLIACANVANMLLARATSRGRELAVRAALGARRVRLVRQLLTEAFLIALTASALGLALAKGLLEALVLISAGSEPVFLMAELDLRVLLFTLGVALATPL
ncbi:MAG: ABC transporter permease, partial [Longimicrobiales bacterium]